MTLRNRTITKPMSKPNVRKALQRIEDELNVIVDSVFQNFNYTKSHIHDLITEIQRESESRK